MDIQSALYSGVQGFQRASAGVTDATIDINRQTRANRLNETEQAVTQAAPAEQPRQLQTAEQPGSLTSSLVQLGQEERNAQANVKSIQTADEVLGTVIDIRV
ncbi:flagellar basal body rod protein FlgG [Rheinheimera pacifica]|uniref:excinuclease ATPase subunit n=1 Tax=Rheinheimera pacifica TaxID=173990 RepID=UPI0028679657|nr:excinuclease ATPase subunit [Rheinheimera pacifica]MDR6984818.1 flagellar basal body rod protein FlgG [Rheinheimera pacifica]